jgi:hypothetical protein
MFKRDPIFWWACGIFILVLVLAAVTQNGVILMLIVFPYLLRPTLASLGLAKKHFDERQMSLNYRSSNIAFVVTIIACILMSAKFEAENNVASEFFFMVIIIGVVAKALSNVLLTKDFREVAPKIIVSVGFFIALFEAGGHINEGIFTLDFFMNILPGLGLIGIGIMSKYVPRIASILILLFALFFIIWSIIFRIMKVGFGDAIGVILIICVPLLSASYGLWREARISDDEGD